MAPGTALALRQLGYRFQPPDALGAEGSLEGKARPRLHLVDDRRPEALPSPEVDPETPIIVLTGTRQTASPDARVAGQVTRPVTLHDLYPLLQHALETEPRRAPRVRTRLAARCLRRNGSTSGQIVSLSLSGCRFRGGAKLEPERTATLRIAVPGEGLVHARARCVWSRGGETGFEFIEPEAATERIIGQYVTLRLGRDLAVSRGEPGAGRSRAARPPNRGAATWKRDDDPSLDRRDL